MDTVTVTSPEPTRDDGRAPWIRLLAWSAGVVAAVDLGFLLLVRTIIPPVTTSVVLTVVGLALMRRWRRTGAIVVSLTALLMLVGGAQFAIPHLDQPSSFVDWTHAVVGLFGRVVVLAAAVGAWRRAGVATARRLGTASAGLFALTLLVAGVTTAASSTPEPAAGDVITTIDDHAFEATVAVSAGDTLFVDNREMFRHTFTVEGTDIDLDLPANGGARTVIDLAPGTYDVRCDIPGHDAMSGTLEVRS